MTTAFAQTSSTSLTTVPAATTQTASIPDLDYSAMTQFIRSFSVEERGRTNIFYKAVRSDGKPFLNAYAKYLAGQDITDLNRDGQLAYWLNVQNLLVIKAITEDTKKTNLKKFRGTGDAPGTLWTNPRIMIDGVNLSIVDIENKITDGWKDTPNLVYGLYQGVKGGPRLHRASFTAANVQEQLAKAAKLYVNANGIIKIRNKKVHVMPVYEWYKADLFGADDQAVIDHIRSHAKANLAYELSQVRGLKVVKLNYRTDNFVPPKPQVTQRIQPSRGTGGFGS
ncbi:MAG: DUF547 domain-containing protein [Robiginitomaculum sp.]|nr:DUF547 domain-containing protein [Robiginitomaculum sp.]